MAVTAKPEAGENSRESALEKQLQFQKKLNDITNKIHSAKGTVDIILNLTDEILGLFEADRMTIYVVDGVRRQVVSKFKTGHEIGEIRVDINNKSISGFCAASGKIVIKSKHSRVVNLRPSAFNKISIHFL